MAFVVAEEERLALHDRPAEIAAELVLLVGPASAAPCRIEEVVRVELVVAEEVVAVPWSALVPDFVLTMIAAPGDQPYSAAYGLVTTLNSSIASTDGREICVVNSCTFSEKLLLATPSSRKLFCSERDCRAR